MKATIRETRFGLLVLLVIGLFTNTGKTQVTNTTMTGTWNSPGNWDNGVPVATGTSTVDHNLILDTDILIEGSCTINADVTDTTGGVAYNITVQGSGVLDMYANVTAEGQLFMDNTGSVVVHSCNTFEVGSVLIQNNTTFLIESCATLVVNGDLNIENNIGIECDGEIMVYGNVLAKNHASVYGSGSLYATGSVDIQNNADIFGNTGDCVSGPCYYGSPLPIELISFEAIPNDGQVDLEWVTASETNNDYFEVQRSADGESFSTISTVDGAGNSVQAIDYHETDFAPVPGVSYYRLKQVDFDGTQKYSYIIPVEYAFSEMGQMLIYPNPAAEVGAVKVRIDNLKGKEVSLVLRDLTGKEVYSQRVIPSQGSTVLGLTSDCKLDNGVYLITASCENVLFSQKLVIK